MTEDHFAGDVAAGYDASLGEMASPEVLQPTVEFLAALAGDGDALEFAIGTGRVALAQHAVSHHFVADGAGVRELRTPFRYVWPSELDLMARLAGLHLAERWADWDRSPFAGDSTSHVSVWHKPS